MQRQRRGSSSASDSATGDGDGHGETSSGKRRLSLRLGGLGNSGKKARGIEHDPDWTSSKGGGGVGGSIGPDPERDIGSSNRGWSSGGLPSTANSNSNSNSNSTRVPPFHSSPSPSSPSSNLSADEPTAVSFSTSSRTVTSGGSSRTNFHPPPIHSASTSSTRLSMPTWRTAPSSDNEQSTQPVPFSGASSGDPPLSTSAPSRLRSPPPTFNLSSGQPLVNPPLKTQAAFVGKLYAMLEDDDITKTGLIHWSADGTIFTCPNPTEFSKIVLPRFFKHNNWQSFVRQLNMYSFNKVNDLFATNSDPGAWEFRHPLFRRGEPHLLASIKRKTTRPSNAEGLSIASPTDEFDAPKAVAGWMKDTQQASFRVNSPPREQLPPAPSASQNRSHGYSMLSSESISRLPDDRRPTSRGVQWETASQPAPLPNRMPPPPPETSVPRYHPDAGRPPLTAHRYGLAGPPAYPESPFYPQPHHSPMDALSTQVATLEDKVQRLHETLNFERIENVRSNLDFTAYLLQLTGWIGDGQPPSLPDMRALQETLNRASAEFRQKYETLMATDALASLASGERRSRMNYELPPQFTPLGPPPPRNPTHPLAEPRLPLAVGYTPRSSPRIGQVSDTQHRYPPPPSEPSSTGGLPPPGPGQLSQYRRLAPDHTRGREPPIRDPRDAKPGQPGPPDILSRPPKEEDEPMEEIKPRTGLSSLLN